MVQRDRHVNVRAWKDKFLLLMKAGSLLLVGMEEWGKILIPLADHSNSETYLL